MPLSSDNLKPYLAYVKFRSDPDNDEVTDGMWCGQQGITVQVLAQIRREVPTLDFEILTARRAAYARLLAQVDKGVFEKAIKGDSKMADLAYRRFEGWSPKQSEAGEKSTAKTFADLIQESPKEES